MEADTPEYWQYRIEKWRKLRAFLVKTFGEKYYLEHLERFKRHRDAKE